jgi:hypothetical protein
MLENSSFLKPITSQATRQWSSNDSRAMRLRSPRSARMSRALLGVLCASFIIFAQTSPPKSGDKSGVLLDGMTYRNPALGMSITLPGQWHKEVQLPSTTGSQATASPKCNGVLCGAPEIRASLTSTVDTAEVVSIIGYHLSAAYEDRKRYPLKWFAQGMLSGSLGGSGWAPNGDLSLISLGGRPAYRLFVRHQASPGVAFGYVSESNQYIFLLVGTALSNPQTLQFAVENMTLKP